MSTFDDIAARYRETSLVQALLAGPILFPVAIALCFRYYGFEMHGRGTEAIPAKVAASTPYQLIAVELLLLLVLNRAMKRSVMTWKKIGWILDLNS